MARYYMELDAILLAAHRFAGMEVKTLFHFEFISVLAIPLRKTFVWP